MYIYSNAFFFTINPVHQNHSHKTLQFNTHYLCLCKICRLNTSFKGPLEAFTSKVQGLFGLMTVTSVSSRLVFALAGLYICLIRVTVWSLRCLCFFPAHHYVSPLSGRLHAACVWVENTDYFCCLTGNGCACLIVSAFVWLGLILQGCANSIAGRSHVCVYR